MARPTNLAGLTVADYAALPGEEPSPQKLVKYTRKPKRTIVEEPVAAPVPEAPTGPQKLVAVRPKKRVEEPPPPEPETVDVAENDDGEPDAVAAQPDPRADMSRATLRKYDREMNLFWSWCEAHQLEPMPAEPSTLAAYLGEKAAEPTFHAPGGRGPRGLIVAQSAIAFAHRCDGKPSPHKSPEVRAVMEGVKRSKGMGREVKAKFDNQGLSAFVAALPASKRGKRDRALVLLKALTRLTVTDLVSLNTTGVGIDAAGLTLKTDGGKEVLVARGNGDMCPVRALTAWIEASGVSSGALFLAVDRWANLGARLSERDVSRIVKRRGVGLGLDVADYSARSLGAGRATIAA